MNFTKTFWKTYSVDVLLFGLLFLLGVYAKAKVTTFFDIVNVYQAQIQVLEPGLASQSAEALLQMESILSELSVLVKGTYILMVFIVPLIIYLLLTLSQSINVALEQKRFDKKIIFKGVGLGLPILGLFYLLENKFVSGFAFLFETTEGLLWFVGILIILFLLSYIWFILLVDQKMKYKEIYKKFHKRIGYYTLYSLNFIVIFFLIGVVLVRYITDSFTGTNWIGSIVVILALIGLLQIVRRKFVKTQIEAS
jgi:hypothetical protein